MSLHPQSIQPIPPLTREVAHQAFPQGNPYMTLRDELGIFYNDLDFAELYATEGQPALRPWRLVLVCVMQYMSDLSDRGAVAAVAARIDWKYALGLELSDSGFDASVLSLFRSRLLKGGKEKLVLDKLLERCQQLNLIKARGQARTDSTHILASIRNLNRLECVGETLRAALNALAVVAPDWLSSVIEDDWFERYSKPVEDSRLPKGTEARNLMAETIGRDGLKILEELYDHPDSPRWLREVPAVETLRMTWVHQYWVNNGQLHWRSHQDLPPAGMRSNSPYDPEARYSKKRHTTWLGYKVHLSETCEKNQVHLITNVKTTEAHLADVDQIESIHQSLAQKELLPKEHLVDTGYVDGTLLVESKQQYGLDLVGPVRENVSWQSKEPDAYDLSRFKINWKTQQATCPQGVKSTKKWTVHQDQWDNTVIGIKFPRQACRECQFRHLCTRSRTEPRELTIRPQQEYLAILKRRQQQQTKKWSKQYNRRAGVEGTISQGVRALGLRNCRYVGLEKVHLQHIFTATAMNVFRLFAWFEGVPLSQTRVSSFAKLAPG
ncbi:IS1182 family transposase (plasmid) [Cyanobacterium sp. IPPAS B-1200]|uniref:IS1182 family transposase n=1 Tax=Cyanobacterium sp. IPPAS B-1200 TaxID=1562720 RepID=UPI00085258A9|nr:IS1182 family transposase [Cyanobacterium sp. IPPAS B-1200]OEJ77583.1 transposase [Cyanobacterium sp. IPPAS B-1200]